MHRPGMISIWFFIGVLLLIYGVLILGAGLYGLSPSAQRGSERIACRHLVGHVVDRAGRFLYVPICGRGGNAADDTSA